MGEPADGTTLSFPLSSGLVGDYSRQGRPMTSSKIFLHKACCHSPSYKMRLEREEKEEHVANPEPDEFTHQYPAEDWRRRFNEATRMIPNTKNAAKMAAPLKPYLNSRDLPKLPEKFYELFLRMPRHIVQKSFVGKGFQTVYTTEYARIKSIIMAKYQNGEM